MLVIPGVGDITQEVLHEMRVGEGYDELRLKLLEERSRAAARQRGDTARDLGHGRLVAQIPATAFHYWEKKLGTGVFAKDEQFLREFLRDNPQCAVNYKTPGRVSLTQPSSSRGGRWRRKST